MTSADRERFSNCHDANNKSESANGDGVGARRPERMAASATTAAEHATDATGGRKHNMKHMCETHRPGTCR